MSCGRLGACGLLLRPLGAGPPHFQGPHNYQGPQHKQGPHRHLHLSSSLRSPLSPTFSTTGSPSSLVTKLSPPRCGLLMLRGSPMAPLPSSHGLDLEEFLPSAREAAGLVTRAAVEGDWEALEGLVEPDCVRVGGRGGDMSLWFYF